MAELDTNIRTQWGKNDIIRNIHTGHPYLVLHVYKYMCTLVVDLESNEPLAPTLSLLARDYDNYTRDENMEAKGTLNDKIEWHYNPIMQTL